MENVFLIIGDNNGRRIKTFAGCLEKSGNSSYIVLDWMDLLDEPEILEGFLAKSSIVKIEPPEKNTKIYEKFLESGDRTGSILFEEKKNGTDDESIPF